MTLSSNKLDKEHPQITESNAVQCNMTQARIFSL